MRLTPNGHYSATGLLFDMDGLLLDTERVAMRAFTGCCLDWGIPEAVAESVFLTMVGASSSQARETVAFLLPSGADVDQFREAWSEVVAAELAQGVPLKPRVSETIGRLAGAGYRMAVVTSTRTALAEEHLERSQLRSHFRAVIGGDSVEAHKPDPAPYLAGAASLGLSTSVCLAFEDSDQGVESAVRAGCKAVWHVPDLRPPDRSFVELGQRCARSLADAVAKAGLITSSG